MPDLLFIYGTLHPDRAPSAIAKTARLLKPLGRATIQACLYDLGPYPGVILSNNPADIVPGELFQLPDAPPDPRPPRRLRRLPPHRSRRQPLPPPTGLRNPSRRPGGGHANRLLGLHLQPSSPLSENANPANCGLSASLLLWWSVQPFSNISIEFAFYRAADTGFNPNPSKDSVCRY
jgi:Gamma-glutamyl cyclotransferase, AIG2-like